MIIDLRSDTVTKPTKEMMQAMMAAEVGDDVYGEDPSINALKEFAARMFGKEAALFCPSGTMTNQIAIKVHTQPGDELICADNAHVYKYEGGGMASNSGVQARVIHGDRGRISADQIAECINSEDVHFPHTRLVCLENTSNRGGGSIYSLESMKAISNLCKKNGLGFHLDGARIFNALVESSYTEKDIGGLFDTVSICLSKGLGAPVGSLLLGSEDFIFKARRVNKVFGGGMRQAGYLAAAGHYALTHHIDRLKEDHSKAKQATAWVNQYLPVTTVMDVETNVVIFSLSSVEMTDQLHGYLKGKNVLCGRISSDSIRFVFHLDVTADHMSQLEKTLSSWKA